MILCVSVELHVAYCRVGLVISHGPSMCNGSLIKEKRKRGTDLCALHVTRTNWCFKSVEIYIYIYYTTI
jgi:hypothetical protein